MCREVVRNLSVRVIIFVCVTLVMLNTINVIHDSPLLCFIRQPYKPSNLSGSVSWPPYALGRWSGSVDRLFAPTQSTQSWWVELSSAWTARAWWRMWSSSSSTCSPASAGILSATTVSASCWTPTSQSSSISKRYRSPTVGSVDTSHLPLLLLKCCWV